MIYTVRYIDIDGPFSKINEIELLDEAIPIRTQMILQEEPTGNTYPEWEISEIIDKKEHKWVDDKIVVVYDDKINKLRKYKIITRIYYLLKK